MRIPKLVSLRITSALMLLVAPLQALQAQVVKEGEDRADVAPSNWSVGAAAGLREGVYAGEGSHVRAFPMIGYEGDRLYFRGLSLGYHLVKSDTFVLDGFIAGRLDAMDADDFGRAELAERGIDRDLLEDRDDAIDLGMSASLRGDAGEIELSIRGDVTGTSDGFEADVGYKYPVRLSRVMLTPGLGVKLLSSDLANYYYGTLDEEVARGLPVYEPGDVTVPYVGVTMAMPFANKWRFIGQVAYEVLPDELQDSPLIEEDTSGVGRIFVGVVYSF